MKTKIFLAIMSLSFVLCGAAAMAEEFGGGNGTPVSTGGVLDSLKTSTINGEGAAKATGQAEVPAAGGNQAQTGDQKAKSTSERIKEKANDVFGGFLPAVGKITSKYGWRVHPIKKKRKFHEGVDISVPTGTKLKAMGDGIVVSSGNQTGYGKVIVIMHQIEGKVFYTRYAHLSQCAPKGTKVKAGEIIPSTKSGNTGWSTGPHLHFEVMDSEKNYLDPQKFFKS